MQLDPSFKKLPISYMKSAVWTGIVPESVIVESQELSAGRRPCKHCHRRRMPKSTGACVACSAILRVLHFLPLELLIVCCMFLRTPLEDEGTALGHEGDGTYGNLTAI